VNNKQFEQVFEDRVEKSRTVLVAKAAEYASDTDRLHNFKKGAVLTESTPEQTLWGFLTKHLVSLSDMITSDKIYSREQWDEKIGDSINYLILLDAQVQQSEGDRAMARDQGRHI
jgi:hypothetical protein